MLRYWKQNQRINKSRSKAKWNLNWEECLTGVGRTQFPCRTFHSFSMSLSVCLQELISVDQELHIGLSQLIKESVRSCWRYQTIPQREIIINHWHNLALQRKFFQVGLIIFSFFWMKLSMNFLVFSFISQQLKSSNSWWGFMLWRCFIDSKSAKVDLEIHKQANSDWFFEIFEFCSKKKPHKSIGVVPS